MSRPKTASGWAWLGMEAFNGLFFGGVAVFNWFDGPTWARVLAGVAAAFSVFAVLGELGAAPSEPEQVTQVKVVIEDPRVKRWDGQ